MRPIVLAGMRQRAGQRRLRGFWRMGAVGGARAVGAVGTCDPGFALWTSGQAAGIPGSLFGHPRFPGSESGRLGPISTSRWTRGEPWFRGRTESEPGIGPAVPAGPAHGTSGSGFRHRSVPGSAFGHPGSPSGSRVRVSAIRGFRVRHLDVWGRFPPLDGHGANPGSADGRNPNPGWRARTTQDERGAEAASGRKQTDTASKTLAGERSARGISSQPRHLTHQSADTPSSSSARNRNATCLPAPAPTPAPSSTPAHALPDAPARNRSAACRPAPAPAPTSSSTPPTRHPFSARTLLISRR